MGRSICLAICVFSIGTMCPGALAQIANLSPQDSASQPTDPVLAETHVIPGGPGFLEPLKATFASPGPTSESAAESSLRTWLVTGGLLVVHFNTDLLDLLGIGVREISATAQPPADSLVPMEPPFVGFAIEPTSTMLIDGVDDVFGGFIGGKLQSSGGFSLVSESGRTRFYDFSIGQPTVTRADSNAPPYLRLSPETADAADLVLESAAIADLDTAAGTMILSGIGMALSDEAAAQLNAPELAGQVFGVMAVLANVRVVDSVSYEQDMIPLAAARGGRDVKLGQLYGIGVAGREGTFPAGDNGLSMATTSCNVGSVDVEWFAAMFEDHPGIAMNLYRISGDRFEQIGQSWIKHGFFALSSSQCTPCQNPSNGTYLGVGCSDTYGFGNNSSRTWLGPRDEWNANAGTWECTGSHFDGASPNCIRNHGGSGHGPIDHRLRVSDKLLGNPGSDYYYEAFYLVRDDNDIFNNAGYKPVTMSWTGSTWSFGSSGFSTPPIEGPAIQAYGDDRTHLQTNEGELYVAWVVTDLGEDNWRYTYSVYNFTFDPAIRAIGIPVDDGFNLDLTKAGMSFYVDQEMPYLSSNWNVTHENGMLVFATPNTHQDTPLANACRWGSTYSFWFECDAPPSGTAGSIMSLEVFDPASAITSLDAVVAGPQPPTPACLCGELAGPADGVVNLLDFSQLALCFSLSASSPGCECSDLNGDGLINLVDFGTLAILFSNPVNGQSPPDCLGS